MKKLKQTQILLVSMEDENETNKIYKTDLVIVSFATDQFYMIRTRTGKRHMLLYDTLCQTEFNRTKPIECMPVTRNNKPVLGYFLEKTGRPEYEIMPEQKPIKRLINSFKEGKIELYIVCIVIVVALIIGLGVGKNL